MCRIQLLPTQKPINKPSWWKEKFVYFRCQQLWGSMVDICPKANSPPTPDKQGMTAFINRIGVTSRNSTVIANSHFQIGHQWSDQHHLGCFRCSYSSAPGSHLFLFLWGQFSELWQLVSWVQSGPHVVNFSPGVLVAIRQLTGYGSEYYL